MTDVPAPAAEPVAAAKTVEPIERKATKAPETTTCDAAGLKQLEALKPFFPGNARMDEPTAKTDANDKIVGCSSKAYFDDGGVVTSVQTKLDGPNGSAGLVVEKGIRGKDGRVVVQSGFSAKLPVVNGVIGKQPEETAVKAHKGEGYKPGVELSAEQAAVLGAARMGGNVLAKAAGMDTPKPVQAQTFRQTPTR